MARELKKGNDQGPSVLDRSDTEHIRSDGGSPYTTAVLKGEEIGMSPDELLKYALGQMEEHKEMVDRLLRHVPRKHEEKIKALSGPERRAKEAVRASSILIGNARRPLEGVSQ